MRGWGWMWLAGCAVPSGTYAPVCEDVPLPEVAGSPTWHDDVAPILSEHCASCHQPGGVGPMTFDTVEDAQRWAPAIAASVQTRQMPPWPPATCDACPPLQHERALAPEEIATIVAWDAAGAPEGTATTPPVSDALPGLERVDVRVGMPSGYVPDATVLDDYRCFVLDPGLATDQFLLGYDFVPGERAVVHHGLVYAVNDAAAAEQREREDPDPGYPCFGGPGVGDATLVAAWAPGAGATMYPQGTGIPLSAGSKLVLEIHYNLANGALMDQTEVALMLADEVERPAGFFQLSQTDLRLPPGQPRVVREWVEPIDGSGPVARVHGLLPHMHTLGQSFQATLERGGASECLIDIPRWDFEWQGVYFFEESQVLNGGDRVRMRCAFDTQGQTEVVDWGDGTNDEMCLMYAYITGL